MENVSDYFTACHPTDTDMATLSANSGGIGFLRS